MIKECLYCRSEFKTSDKRRKFCNQGCYLSYKKDNIELYNDTIFNKGHKPWNKDLKGVMKPNKTSFKKGRSNPNKKEIGCESLRKSNGRVFVKVANPNKWRYRAVCVWESIYGKIKKGDVVHHIDGTKTNDVIENLIALPRKDHQIFHNSWGIKQLTEEQLKFYRSRYEL